MSLPDAVEQRALIRAINLGYPLILQEHKCFYMPLWTVTISSKFREEDVTLGGLFESFEKTLAFVRELLSPYKSVVRLSETSSENDKVQVALYPQAA